MVQEKCWRLLNLKYYISNFLVTILRKLIYIICFLSLISLPPLNQTLKTDSSILLVFSRNAFAFIYPFQYTVGFISLISAFILIISFSLLFIQLFFFLFLKMITYDYLFLGGGEAFLH